VNLVYNLIGLTGPMYQVVLLFLGHFRLFNPVRRSLFNSAA